MDAAGTYYHAADFGCGADLTRLRTLSGRHPDWRFLGVDTNEPSYVPPNVDFIRGKANESLARLCGCNAGEIYLDFLLGNMEEDERLHLLRSIGSVFHGAAVYVSEKAANLAKRVGELRIAGYNIAEAGPLESRQGWVMTPFAEAYLEASRRVSGLHLTFARAVDGYDLYNSGNMTIYWPRERPLEDCTGVIQNGPRLEVPGLDGIASWEPGWIARAVDSTPVLLVCRR